MPNKKLKILFAAAEVAPLAKVGGLGDVAGALPKALIKLNLDVRVIMPFYGALDKNKYKIKLIKRNIKSGGASINLYLTEIPDSAAPLYLIEHSFFKGQKIYSAAAKDLKKFVFFSRAILESVKAINFAPDIIHLNDWHTAVAAALLKTDYQADPFFKQTKTLYTIHNLANQGLARGKNYMAEGILKADLINTVSPTYAKEILKPEQGAGLEKILKKRKTDLYGVLNGIDTALFNPISDNLIGQKYSLKNLEKKTANKLALQKQLGWPENENTALVGLISRLTWQKGLDLITEKFSRLNCQFVFLGRGEKRYEETLLNLAEKYPKKFKTLIKFDEKLAHEIYAGADIFLMPSRFEPCGLGQMIAMRYGAAPLARATGGLADTVDNKTGFTFKKYASRELYKTLSKALAVFYKNKKLWRRLKINGLKRDFSWDKPAREYLKLYKKLIPALTK